MKKEYRELFQAMNRFHTLKISMILPNISRKECSVMMAIKHCENEDGKANASAVVEHSHTSSPAVSRTFRALEQKKYIVRSVDDKDRRNTLVELTELGKSVLAETEQIMEGFGEAVMDNMKKEELQCLCDYFNKIYDVAETEIVKRKYKGKE